MAYPSHVHPLSRSGAAAPADAAPDRVIAGSGAARAWNAFTDPSGRFDVGYWQGEPGRLRVAYTECELCVLVVGRVRLIDERGGSAEFGPGDAFVIASGFRGTWESIGRVTKIYAVLQPDPEAE